MVDGRERRALAAGPDIGGAEIIDHRNAQGAMHAFAVAELPRGADAPRLRRPMQHRLAVEADRADIGRPKPGIADELRDRRRLRVGQRPLGFVKNLRFRAVEVPTARLRQRLLEQVPHRPVVGRQRIRPELGHLLAVRPQQRHIDVAVEDGAGHQADGPDRVHGALLSCH